MERTTFLKNYRIRVGYDGSPHEPDHNGPALSYEAMDERTAEPVSVTLVPVENIDQSERELFEENASAAQKLRHVNVAKVLDFGRDGDDYVYVSERLGGETLASWVRNHGPMPADAALRVAEQIVSVLSSAAFHKIPYPSIQPSDIMLVPGQTAEGSWPLVKVISFGLPERMTRPGLAVPESEMQKVPGSEEPVASMVQTSQPTKDLRSEIYSLGVTLYFLLSGVALSADALQRGPTFPGFPKPLRFLLGRVLHRDPSRRPKDLLVLTELIRRSLETIERRRALSDRYGIPLKTTVAPQTTAPPRRLLRTAVAFGLLLALAVAIAPMVFPDSIGKLLRITREPKPVGVLIGVRESSPPPQQRAGVVQAPQNKSTAPPPVVASEPINPSVAPDIQAPTNAETPSHPPDIRTADVQQAQVANAQPEAPSPTDSAQNSPGTTPDSSSSAEIGASASAQANAEPPPTTGGQSRQNKRKSVTATSTRLHAGQSSKTSSRGRHGSVRSRVVGITSDGRLILRLSSGRTAIVAPDEESAPRRRNRVFSERDDILAPPPGFGPDYFPND
jgi:serine/threonine protein kinase